jgi:hypothetical protein
MRRVLTAFVAAIGVMHPPLVGAECTKPLAWGVAGLITVDTLQSKAMVGHYRNDQYAAAPSTGNPMRWSVRQPASRPATATQERAYRYEQNPLLGSEPSNGDFDRMWALSMAGIALGCYALPAKWADALLWGWGAAETVVIVNNHRIGLQIAW